MKSTFRFVVSLAAWLAMILRSVSLSTFTRIADSHGDCGFGCVSRSHAECSVHTSGNRETIARISMQQVVRGRTADEMGSMTCGLFATENSFTLMRDQGYGRNGLAAT